jgi:hypothetical protein
VARNQVLAQGRQVQTPVIAGTTLDGPVIIGMLPGVALTDRDVNGSAVVQVGAAVFNLPVTGAIATVGSPVYITSATTPTVSGASN